MKNLFKYIILIAIASFFIFPLLWIIISSLKPQGELFTYPPRFFPKIFTLENYKNSLTTGNFLIFFRNTVIVSVTRTILMVLINTMAGYALAKYYFKGRNIIFYSMIATLMIPLQVIMVPIFLLLKNLGLLNNLLGIIIPPSATPTGIFMTRQYMLTIPNSFIEAARIDGANEWFIFRKIIFPLARPIVATLAIFSFMWSWNDFLWPFIVISTNKLNTLQLALANFVGQYQINWGTILAMTVITMFPMIIVFLSFQKYFIRGLTTGGVKF